MRALRKLHRDQNPKSAFVFASERGGPITPDAINRLVKRIGNGNKLLGFPIHFHMLRHSCGFALANAGHDTRSIQDYLGHKSIQHTVRYTELAPTKFTLGGCLLTDKPEPGLDIPLAYELGPKNPTLAAAALPTLDWWRGFRSKELTEIIEEARAANLDIAVAVAQIVQADAQSRVAGAPLLPLVNLNGSATHLRSSQATSLGGATGLGGSERDLTASYEIDFWGKNRSALRAAGRQPL